MTLKQYTLEGSNGTTATTGNTSAAQLSSSPGTITFDTGMAAHGTTGLKVVSAASVIAIGRFLANAPAAQMAFEYEFTSPAVAPGAGTYANLGTLRHSSGVAIRWKYTSANALVMSDAGGINDVTIKTGLSVATHYRLAIVATVGAATSAPYDGEFTANLYPAGDSLTSLNASPINNAVYNLGTNPIVGGDFGVTTVVASVVTTGFDDIQFNDGSSAEIGPLATPSLPFASWTTTTNWSTVGGGTVAANLSDNNDSTGIITLSNPTAQVLEGKLPGVVKPGVGVALVCPLRGFRSASVSGSITAKLYLTAGGTLKSTVTGIAIPTSVGAINVTFPAGDLTSITEAQFAAGLTVRLEVTAA